VPLPEYHPGALPAVPQALDLVVPVARDQAPSFAELQDVLDHGERLAAAGSCWPAAACRRSSRCATGRPSRSSPSSPARRRRRGREPTTSGSPPTSTAVPCPTGWDRSKVDDADVGVIAVTEDNRVCAISAPLVEVLGWPADELVGRRVVAIVPPRFREAHVAGFSRHLSTGDARALGVQLRLPVLTRGGQEVECEFLIESEATPEGHVVYLAHITPVLYSG
jgi:PAS domain S-box-containing protein